MDWFREDVNFDAPGVTHCCKDMTAALTNVCEMHAEDAFACHDMVVSFSGMFREYGLKLQEQGQSIVIKYCPWCGARLPASLRDTWFERLEELGIDEPFDEGVEVPLDYRSATWWQAEGGGAKA